MNIFIEKIDYSKIEEFISFVKMYTLYEAHNCGNYIEVYQVKQEDNLLVRDYHIVEIINIPFIPYKMKIDDEELPFRCM